MKTRSAGSSRSFSSATARPHRPRPEREDPSSRCPLPSASTRGRCNSSFGRPRSPVIRRLSAGAPAEGHLLVDDYRRGGGERARAEILANIRERREPDADRARTKRGPGVDQAAPPRLTDGAGNLILSVATILGAKRARRGRKSRGCTPGSPPSPLIKVETLKRQQPVCARRLTLKIRQPFPSHPARGGDTERR